MAPNTADGLTLMMLTLTFLHMLIVIDQETVDHATRVLQIPSPPTQCLIVQGGETIDPSRRAWCRFLVPRREHPSPPFHVTECTVDSTRIDICQAILA